MEITQELIQERLEDLHNQERQARGTLEAISGAIQDCEFWAAALAKPPELATPQESPQEETTDDG